MSEIKESQLPIGQRVSSFRGLDTSQNSILISVDDASLALGVNSKANATDVAKQFADRDTALTESLALKSDITSVDQQLLLKADLIYVDQQLATKATAIDYSSLEEQIVPGEFSINRNMNRSQVYIRTFIGTTSQANWTRLFTLPNSGCVINACGSSLQSSSSVPNQCIGPSSIIRGSSNANDIGLSLPGRVNFYDDGGIISGIPKDATYFVTLKYVK